MWEDPANKEGGKWLIMSPNSKKQELDTMWLNTVCGAKLVAGNPTLQ